MKKNRILALVLALSVLAGTVSVTAFAAGNSGKDASEETTAPAVTTAAQQEQTTKDEMVYVLADAAGGVKKILVSDHLENALGLTELPDDTDLQDMQVVKGDASYVQKDDGGVWQTGDGSDVYYQGVSDQELPVNLTVTYRLDGEEIAPADLLGKSGSVTIRLSFENRQMQTVKVDGKNRTVYVPFAVLSGTVLDADHFRNVTVTNGKVIVDGSRMLVAGVALPGLQENLKLDADKLEIPSYVEITADVTDFTMTNTWSLVTNSVFSALDTDALDDLDTEKLEEQLDALTSGMKQLMDGSDALYDGLTTLLSKADELSGGVSQLANGLSTLSSNSSTLNSGAYQVFQSLISVANSQIAASGLEVPTLTVSNYSEVLSGVLATLDSPGTYAEQAALEKVTAAVNAQADQVRAAVRQAVEQEVSAQVTEGVKANVWSQILATANLTPDSYEAALAAGQISDELKAQLEGALTQQMQSETVQATISQLTEQKMAGEDMTALVESKTAEQIDLLIRQNMASQEVQDQIAAATAQVSEGAKQLRALKQQLDSYSVFYDGLRSYTAGVDSASSGASTLKSSMPALKSGISQLQEGAKKMCDGLDQFNSDGVEKLVNAVDGDLSTLAQNLRATLEAAQQYRSFSGVREDMDGEVKFLYRTDAIE